MGMAVGGFSGILVGYGLGDSVHRRRQEQPTVQTHQSISPLTTPAAAPAAPDPQPAPQPALPADQGVAARIAQMGGAQRDAALCAIENQADHDLTFRLLERNPDRFLGHLWVFTGRAIQVEDVPGERGSFMLITLDGYGSKIVSVFTFSRPGDEIVADRRVRVYGRIAGTFSYETRDRQDREVPKVLGVAVLRPDDAPHCPRVR